MADKGPEVMVCDASIMKNVWEIRLREYGQKLKLENDRIEKSALEKINDDWAKRMAGKVKPRKVERKAKPPEDSSTQTFKTKTPLGRPSGFVSRRQQKSAVDLKKEPTKRNKLALLLRLSESQPGLMIWTKSWKFSQSLSQTEQMPSVSDWGQSWKFFNLQPNNEGKSWMEQEYDSNNNITTNDDLFLWNTTDNTLHSTQFEQDVPWSDWEKSWKYTKQSKESHRNEEKNSSLDKLHVLQESQSHNEERSLSEWNESWKSVKPPNEEHVKFISSCVNEPENIQQHEQESGIIWGESWKHFKKELHMKSKSTSLTQTGWSKSWRISKPTSKFSQQEKILNPAEFSTNMPDEPLDPTIYQTIMNVSRDDKYKIRKDFQIQERDGPMFVDEWQKSWVTIRNLTEYKEQLVETPEVPKEAREKSGFNVLPMKPVKFESISFPKACKPAVMLDCLKQKDNDFISTWKDSWKSFKHLRRQERVQSRRQRTFSSARPSLTEWLSSWRLTNLNPNQNDSLWQQGWTSYIRPRPDRWARENEVVIEHFPLNGPTGARGWGESWRSTRHQHRVERESTHPTSSSIQPDPHIGRRARSLEDWQQSWQFSATQHLLDRLSVEEWAASWRYCNFHSDNLLEQERELHHYKTSLDIKVRKERHCPSTKFSKSFEPQNVKEMCPPNDWNKSWRTKMVGAKQQPGLLHLTKKDHLEAWDNSWMFSFAQFYQSESTDLSIAIDHTLSGVASYDSQPEWGRSWKFSNPQPPKNIASWFEAQPNKCSPQYLVFWAWHKRNKDFLSLLSKNYVALRIWDKAWRFMKMESKLDLKSGISKSKQEDDSVIMGKAVKLKKCMYSQIDEDVPQVRRWADACKLAKTQPRPRRDVRLQPSNDAADRVMFAEWAESWRFTNNFRSVESVKKSVSLTDWEDSWKFLLTPYAAQNGPKQTKGRS